MEYENVVSTFYAWLGFTVIALMHVKLLTQKAHDIEREQHTAEPTVQDTAQFPWEPRDQSSINEEGENNDNSEPLQPHDEEQSDFMSMMTFANQTLRQPSCPCCR